VSARGQARGQRSTAGTTRKTGSIVPVVRARCVQCGGERDVRPGEVAAGDVPMCLSCFAPMVAVQAIGVGS
jgi:hypothetical protein